MDCFQLTAASTAIILEVFSEDVLAEMKSANSQREMILRMRSRVAAGEFWPRLGGLDTMERELKAGFSDHGLNRSPDANTGKFTEREFPRTVTTLFSMLRECAGVCGSGKTDDSSPITVAARAALPVLRGFVGLKCITSTT